MSHSIFYCPPKKDGPYTEPLGVKLTSFRAIQNYFDSLYEMLKWVKGFAASGKGTVPGYYGVSDLYNRMRTNAANTVELAALKKKGVR